MNQYTKWIELKKEIKRLTEELHDTEASIYIRAQEQNQLNPNGSKTFTDNEFNITIKHNETVKVNQELAAKNQDLFRIKYEFDKKLYSQMTGLAGKSVIDEAITITPSKPTFTVEYKEMK